VNFEIPNYTLQKKLGEGAMADVWLAQHKHNARKAAIKVLKPVALNDKEAERLFLREGQVLASFDHKNIVKIYDNDRKGDLAFIVMELLPGGTLLQRMQDGPIQIDEAIGLVTQIAGALDAAHMHKVIHRDLKPANVMLRDATTPVLTDFGAARMLDRSTIYGRDGRIIGTPIYMSPEQITGQALTGCSDLYALGVMFHQFLTERLPFSGGSLEEIAMQHLMAPLPELPLKLAMLQPVLAKLLAKKVVDRYAGAQEFIDALRHVFLRSEALRQQVSVSSTFNAWSSQLRALGFGLDSVQKVDVSPAQGNLATRAAQPDKAAVAPVPVAKTVRSPMLPSKVSVLSKQRFKPPDITERVPKNSRAGLWFAALAALAMIAVGFYSQITTPIKISGTDTIVISDILAVRERYIRAADRLMQIGAREKRDLSATQAVALKLAEQATKALDNQDFNGALRAYQAAEATLRKAALALLDDAEVGYRRAANAALDAGKIDESKSQVELAKEIRALKAQWDYPRNGS
jgi:serine/threonine-protein kinase PpkA